MDLKLNDILNLSQDELKNSKIELNMTAGSGAESFMIRWLKTDKVVLPIVLIGGGMEKLEIFILIN